MRTKFTTLIIILMAIFVFSSQLQAQTDVSGLVLYHFKPNKPIPSVNLSLIDTAGVVVATTVTEMNGSYTFTNVPYGSYTMTAQTNISSGGITMGDAFLMFLNLCNVYTFTPIQELAADVDGDGTVTWNDYWTVVIGWFVQGYPFPVGPWTFENVSFTLSGTKTNVPTMGGSSAGDVNGTFVPATRDLPVIEAIYTTKQVASDFSVEIYAKNITETSAMGLVVNYPATMVDVSDVTCQLGETNMAIENGQIRLSWINQSNGAAIVNPDLPILVIKAKTNSSYNGNDIKFEVDPSSHFSNYQGEQINTSYTLPLITNSGSFLGANYPNPFSSITNITYYLPADTKVNISLYNQQGQLVTVLMDAAENAGTHNIVFESNGLESGVYYYTLKTTGLNALNETKRMIITR